MIPASLRQYCTNVQVGDLFDLFDVNHSWDGSSRSILLIRTQNTVEVFRGFPNEIPRIVVLV